MIEPPKQAPTIEIKPLTAFRFFAAFAVFLSHLSFLDAQSPELAYLYTRVFYEGYVGVTFFFVLSGFILTYSYRARIETIDFKSLKNYYLARFARIYPVHLLTFVASLPLVYQVLPKDIGEEAIRALANLSLTHSLIPDGSYYFSFDKPSWSLADEACFYLLFPFILAFLIKFRLTRPMRALALGVGLMSLYAIVTWWLKDVDGSHYLFAISPLFRLGDFLTGALLCFIFLPLSGATVSVPIMTVAEAVALVGFGGAYALFPYIHPSFRSDIYYVPPICFVILVFAFQRGYISKVLSHRILVFLGELSFSFYLFHQLVLRYMGVYNLPITHPIIVSSIALLVSLTLSYVCYWLYESPVRASLRQVSFHRPLSLQEGQSTVTKATPWMGQSGKWADPGVSRYLLGGSGLVLATVTAVTYFPSLQLGFLGEIWKPLEAVARTPLPHYLLQLGLPQGITGEYRPVSAMNFAAEYLVFGTNPTGYHIIATLIHFATVLLFFRTLYQITGLPRLALVASILYAGSPIVFPSVFNIADPQPMVGFFYLLSVCLWVSFLRTGGRGYYLAVLAAASAAFLSGQTSVTLPVTLLLLDCLLIQRHTRLIQLVYRYLPFVILALVFLFLPGINSGEGGSVFGAFASLDLSVFVGCLALIVFPWGMYHPIVLVAAPLVVGAVAWKAFRTRHRGMAFLLLEAGLLMLPSLGMAHQGYTLPFLYLPGMVSSVGWALLFELLRNIWGAGRRLELVAGELCAICLVAFINAMSVANAAYEWRGVTREARAPFREVIARHPSLPTDTLLFFIDPPSKRDLTGLSLFQYGDRVSVRSSSEGYLTRTIPYPIVPGAIPKRAPAAQVGDFVAGLHDHRAAFVYYADSEARFVEVAVDQAQNGKTVPPFPAVFNRSIRLENYEVASHSVKPGQALILLLYWRVSSPIDKDYTLFVHLLDREGHIVDGYDTLLLDGNNAATSSWSPGASIVTNVVFPIVSDASPGESFHLEVGLYHFADMVRLAVVGENDPAVFDHIIIESFDLQ